MKLVLLLLLLFNTTSLFSQSSSLFIPLDVRNAYTKGTRTYDGTVSNNYWINHTDYKIDVEFFPDSNLIVGTEKIIYFNESPDSLSKIVIRLYQNITKPGVVKNWNVPANLLDDGVEIKSLIVQGDSMKTDSESAKVDGTNLIIIPNKTITANSKTKIEITWKLTLPKHPLRMGNYGGDFFIAYWYPQVAVYDDIYGWDVLQYSGTVEFYNDFNNYDINYTLPDNYVVWSTGNLENTSEVFHKNIVSKIKKAKKSDKIINIITSTDYANNDVTLSTANKKNTWHYTANAVPDVAWAVSNNYNWDASSVEVEPGRDVLASAVYPDSIVQNKNVALYARETIEYMSKVSPDIAYPWCHTTAFTNKTKGGGMEFPMMQNNGAPKKIRSCVGLTFHEIAHSYFPFYMGTNERRAAWMDEGWASFFPREIVEKYDSSTAYAEWGVSAYERFAGKTKDMPMVLPSYMMTHGESRNNFYNRPYVAYEELRQLLGNNLFHKALREYINRWHNKHPIGYDFFFTFNNVVGEDLSWFWKPWFFDFGYPDLALDNIEQNKESLIISVSKLGNIPTRIQLTLVYKNGKKEIINKSAKLWKGKNFTKIIHKTDKRIKSVLLGSNLIPDVNDDNNFWDLDK